MIISLVIKTRRQFGDLLAHISDALDRNCEQSYIMLARFTRIEQVGRNISEALEAGNWAAAQHLMKDLLEEAGKGKAEETEEITRQTADRSVWWTLMPFITFKNLREEKGNGVASSQPD